MCFIQTYFRKGQRDLLLLLGFEPLGSELLGSKIQPTTYEQNVNVCEGVQGMILFIHCWLCEQKCSHFFLFHLCPLSPSQALQFHCAVEYLCIFCFFFFSLQEGTALSPFFRFSSYLPTTTPLIFQLCILVPVAHPVFFQQPVFPCLVLLFLFLQYSL